MYNKVLVFTAACIGMLLFGIVLISIGSILPALVAQYGLDELAAGSLVSVLPFGILAGSLVFGPVVDRYGYKSILIINTILVLLGLQGLAFSGSFILLQASILLIGFSGGVINGGVNALVADISPEGKGANLSLLGVFFGIGALGMPALLGALSKSYNYQSIISVVGFFVVLPVVFFLLIKFPAPKQLQGLPLKKGFGLARESALLLMSFFLFFQSGVEGLLNNWTTTYLQKEIGVSPQKALFALSYLVAGMTAARLLLGGLLKKVSSYRTLYVSLAITFAGSLVLMTASSYELSVFGLVLMGIGVAGGFPIILGYVAEIYAHLSGTAFSIALVIALIGNMIINYLMGVISHIYGIGQFSTFMVINLAVMAILLSVIKNKIGHKVNL